MVEIYLCCAPQDREVAAAIAARLEAAAEAKVILDDGEAGTVAQRWEGGVLAGGIVLLLAPETVPKQVSRTEWGALLDHVSKNEEPPVVTLVLRECGYPKILERKKFYRWPGEGGEVLRAIHKWAVGLHRLPEQRSFSAARLPWFEGREAELAQLWETLVDGAGRLAVVKGGAGSGKTSFAQEFARRAAEYFRDVIWVACDGRSEAEIVAHLAEQIGVDYYPGEPADAFSGLLELAGRHRVLVVFDDLPAGMAMPQTHGRASVLVTGRAARPAALVLSLPKVAGGKPKAPEDEGAARLWRAMAVCRPSGFPLELAAGIAGLDEDALLAARAKLVEQRLAEPLDDVGGWMRLSAASAAAGKASDAECRRHAELVHAAAAAWESRADFRKRYSGECLPAFRWAAKAEWGLALGIARHMIAFLRHHNRLAEATALLMLLRSAADEQGEWQVSDECSWELSWIRGVPYKGAGWAPVDGDQMALDFSG